MANPCTIIIKKLSSLPDLPFTEQENDEIIFTLKNLELMNLEAIQAYAKKPTDLSESTQFFNNHINAIVVNLQQVTKLLPELVAWSIDLSKACETVRKETIALDNFLPVIIDFLPGDEPLLSLIKEKLDLFALLKMYSSTGDAASYTVVTLYSAIVFKLNQLKAKDFEKQLSESDLHEMTIEYEIQPTIRLLLNTCNDYLKFLTAPIRNELKKDPFAYRYYYTKDKPPAQVIKQLINDFTDKIDFLEGDYICKKNDILELFLSKYQIIMEMINTLNQVRRSSTDRLAEFSKLVLNLEALAQPYMPYMVNSILDMSARFFGQAQTYRTHVWNSTEGDYLNVFSSVILPFQMKTIDETSTKSDCRM